jgi:hypothetical protein
MSLAPEKRLVLRRREVTVLFVEALVVVGADPGKRAACSACS